MALPPPADSSTALVTGASSGIGVAIARELAGRGYGLALVARREQRLRELAAELTAEHGVRVEVIAADLSDAAERARLAQAIDDLGLDVEIVVNNAGFGDSGKVTRAEPARLGEMVRLNCEAVVDLQARYTPSMAERGRGAVINVASTAAFQPMPGTATYAATKAFVLSFSEATHAELRDKGVAVTALCPGPVKTEFVDTAGMSNLKRVPELVWTSAESVARAAVEGADAGKRVVVPGALNRITALGGQHAPRALALPLIRRGSRGL